MSIHLHINNCQYKDSTDVEVFVTWGKEIDIYPEYIRTTKSYSLKSNDPYTIMFNIYRMPELEMTNIMNILNPPRKINYTWCTVPFIVKNTGSSVIEDYKLYLNFDHTKIEELDDKFHYYNSPLVNQAAVAQINASKEAKREVFETEYFDLIEYIPLEKVLVQDDARVFEVGVKPKQGVEKITVIWNVKSRNYQKRGELSLNVKPKYEDRAIDIKVIDPKELKEPEIIIEPKIIEK